MLFDHEIQLLWRNVGDEIDFQFGSSLLSLLVREYVEESLSVHAHLHRDGYSSHLGDGAGEDSDHLVGLFLFVLVLDDLHGEGVGGMIRVVVVVVVVVVIIVVIIMIVVIVVVIVVSTVVIIVSTVVIIVIIITITTIHPHSHLTLLIHLTPT